MTEIITADISNLSSNIYDEFYQLIEPSRKSYADCYVFKRDKNLSVVSEICLYYLLATKYYFNDTLLTRGYRYNGKPFFKNISNLYYSVSHSSNKCIVGISDRSEIGLDIECTSELKSFIFIDYISNLFSKEEIAAVKCGEDVLERSIVLWTQKEALFKALGVGSLRHILRKRLTRDEKHSIVTVLYDGYVVSVANAIEKITILDAKVIGMNNIVDVVKRWKIK